MIAYLCNHCKKPIDMEREYCAHLEIRWGKRAIDSKGQYGDGYAADLCEDCYKKLSPMIDDYYYGGNKYLRENQNGKEIDV